MTSLRTIRFLSITAALVCVLAAGQLAAQAPTVTYSCTGTFSTPAVSGADTFKLAGEPFNISSAILASTPPSKYGPTWAEFSNLKLTGTVHSGLVPTPFTLSSNKANLELAVGNPSYDVFFLGAPIQVISITVNLLAEIKMPTGTITKPLIHPFTAPVTLSPTNTQVVYVYSGANTVLTIASGTLNATCPSGVTCNPTASLRVGPPEILSMPTYFAGLDELSHYFTPVVAQVKLGHLPTQTIHLD
jgi:hypothetical protein